MNKRKRGVGTDKTPPQSSPTGSSVTILKKTASKEKFICPICDEVIVDAVGSKCGDDSIQCDGRCATWLHRRCAGLSKVAFNDLVSRRGSDPFFCPMCRLDQQELELKSLRDLVSSLSSHISLIADELAALKQDVPSHVLSDRRTYAQVLDANVSDGARPEVTRPTSPNTHVSDPSDRKYNLLIFGLKESSKGTPRFRRETKDFSDVCSILTSVDTSISPQAVRDCFRLGKYKPDKDRPIMVKFVRSHDVVSVLSNRKNLASHPGISIKPDLSPAQRKAESILLKERRSLINSGVAKEDIKIKGNALLVNKAKYGHAVGDAFQRNPISVAGTSVNTESPIEATPNSGPVESSIVTAPGDNSPCVNTQGINLSSSDPSLLTLSSSSPEQVPFDLLTSPRQ